MNDIAGVGVDMWQIIRPGAAPTTPTMNRDIPKLTLTTKTERRNGVYSPSCRWSSKQREMAGKRATFMADRLETVHIPILFVQGVRSAAFPPTPTRRNNYFIK